MGTITFSVGMTVRFWVKPYLAILKIFCLTFNTEPDYQKLTDFIAKRGIKVTIT